MANTGADNHGGSSGTKEERYVPAVGTFYGDPPTPRVDCGTGRGALTHAYEALHVHTQPSGGDDVESHQYESLLGDDADLSPHSGARIVRLLPQPLPRHHPRFFAQVLVPAAALTAVLLSTTRLRWYVSFGLACRIRTLCGGSRHHPFRRSRLLR